MVEVRIEQREAFRIAGQKTWISGQDNEQFGRFWAESRTNGLLAKLDALRGARPGAATGALVLGLSATDRDPTDRRFWFYIGIEVGPNTTGPELEEYPVPAGGWAVFRNRGQMPDALIAAEMMAFGEWLPTSGYRHANGPELEVYPSDDSPGAEVVVEFWLPIER